MTSCPQEANVYAIQPVDNKQALAWLIKVEKNKSGLKDKYEFGHGEYSKLNYGAAKVTLTSCVDKSDEEFAVMAKFRGRRLCMWRNIDKKWSDINLVFNPPWCYRNIYIEDIIYHNKKFYVLLSSGVIMTVDSKSLGVTKVGRELSDLDCDFMLYLLYLLESHNNLFLIAKFPAKEDSEDCLKVFKLDEENRRWVQVVNELEFEGRVIFLSEDGSYSLSAKELRPCKENCVYFKKEIRVGENRYPGEDAWIFNLKTRKDKKLSKFPGYAASLFWPPPSWLKQ
ncbi:F-box protein SKIP23-like [Pistacia vera]|uniref:F-box protein SKIP23-like n=1 Tax=Pistacia vera TaxID=55513 RepID=UPI0012636755|nr:F-box protein SKIP23-like [Pistacia vera]